MTITKPWADTPLALISETGVQQRPDIPTDHFAIRCAQNMATLHNAILRSFNSSYNQCLGVRPDTAEARDFLQYNQALYEHIKEHHDAEEDMLFPSLQEFTGENDTMDQNIQEHQDMHEALQKLRDYAFNTDANAYDGENLRSILDLLAPALKTHLHAEIPTFLDLAKYDSQGLRKLWEQFSRKAASRSTKTRVGPMMFGSMDDTFLMDGKSHPYPEVPFFVPYLFKYILSSPRSGAWRFNPSDFFGVPRPLAFPNPTCDEAA